MGRVRAAPARFESRGGCVAGARRAIRKGASTTVFIKIGQGPRGGRAEGRERPTKEGALGAFCFCGRPRRRAPRRCGVGGRAENYGSFTKRFSCISRRVPAATAGPGPVARGAAAAAASTKSQRAAPAPLIVEVRQTDAAAASLSTARPVAGAARGAGGRRLVRAARPLRPDAVPARPRSQTGGARGAPRRLGLALAVVRLFQCRLAAVGAVLRVAPVYLF